MHVENMIYMYLVICLAMIGFNIACIVSFKQRDRLLQKHSDSLEKIILNQIPLLKSGEGLTELHYSILRRKMAYVHHLMTLDDTMKLLYKSNPEEVTLYARAIRPVFNDLAQKNHYRNSMQRAYFAYVVKKYRILEEEAPPAVVAFMMELLKDESLYCRENALQAIYSTGNCQLVLRALRQMEVENEFHHGKLLTDGLLNFSGDRETLMHFLWTRFDEFTVPMQIVILDFIRFGGGHMEPEVLAILVDDKRDDELRFSCLRYFGRMVYEPAYPVLLAFLERADERRWEYAAISATALGAYKSERTIGALKQALYSENWYIRFNAAKSLERFKLTYLELSDVMNSGDRYAREILQYQFDVKRAKEERGAMEA